MSYEFDTEFQSLFIKVNCVYLTAEANYLGASDKEDRD